ncbi:hypothetical protein AB0B89_28870 [Sphaerisporangium sp. NPDC049002]|uniref:hypothetical protein n=1 Tax=Sphaerisporangium sp. NPDC049002 TaxID=3155392 RepID=UPI0033CFBFDB
MRQRPVPPATWRHKGMAGRPQNVPDHRHHRKGLISGMGGKEGLDLSAPQIAGSALAAATAAVAASFLGVTGTIIGAAVASAATTVGNAVYTHYLKRTRDRLKEAHGLITGQQEAQALREEAEESALARPGENGLATAAHATVRDHGPPELPPTVRDPAPLGAGAAQAPPLRREGVPGPLWVTLVVATVATFALSMGGILAFELLSGRPLAATVHGRSGSGTSWGGQVDDSEPVAPTPSASEGVSGASPSPKASPGTSREAGPTTAETGRPSAPSSSASPDGSVPPAPDSGTEDQGDGRPSVQPSTTSK